MAVVRKFEEGQTCFNPEEAAVLKAAYDDAMAKPDVRVELGPNPYLASEIITIGALRASLGQTLCGHSDAQLLSFLARQSLK